MGRSSIGVGEGNGTTPVLLPGKSHGWRSLEGCSPWGREESDRTEWLHFHFSLSCIGEGNGNPLQYPCLENPRDGGAWWAAVCGIAQSRTRLKRLSSSILTITVSNKCDDGKEQIEKAEWMTYLHRQSLQLFFNQLHIKCSLPIKKINSMSVIVYNDYLEPCICSKFCGYLSKLWNTIIIVLRHTMYLVFKMGKSDDSNYSTALSRILNF